MKILVTGANGMLGSDLCPIMREQHTVLATDIHELDVRDWSAVREAVHQFLPDVVIHLAALTDVDFCERRPDEAFRTNTIGTQLVALACREVGATIVYVSTLSVFDGRKPTPYIEFDTPNPQSVYSQSKYQGERAVQTLWSQHYITRAGWLFGGGTEDKKFVAKILDLAQTKPELKIVDDKFGSPTYTVDFARGLQRLIETGLFGVYHLVNTQGGSSRYDVARAILDEAGITTCQLLPVSSAEFPLPAPRPRMEAGRNCQLELLGFDWMRDWHAALRDYLHRLGEPVAAQGELAATR